MCADIIDGNTIASKIRAELRNRAQALAAQNIQPGLAVILVGDDPASCIYVRNKAKACKESGIHSEVYNFPGETPQEVVLEHIQTLNANPKIHGILVQLPLPPVFPVDRYPLHSYPVATPFLSLEIMIETFFLTKKHLHELHAQQPRLYCSLTW